MSVRQSYYCDRCKRKAQGSVEKWKSISFRKTLERDPNVYSIPRGDLCSDCVEKFNKWWNEGVTADDLSS